MSNDEQLMQVSREIHDLVRRKLSELERALTDAGLRVVLEPIGKSAQSGGQNVWIEATVFHGDEVDDVLFLYIAREGERVVDTADVGAWVDAALDQLLHDRGGST